MAASQIRAILFVILVSLVFSGCAFNNPVAPNLFGGTIPVNTNDQTTSAIAASYSQVSSQGIYLSVRDQDGQALTSNWFNSANFQISYNQTMIASGSITVTTSSSQGSSIASALVLDYSGSMATTDVTAMETAATTFVNNMLTMDRGEIIKFATDVQVVQTFTSDKQALRDAIAQSTTDRGSTSLYDAVETALNHTAAEAGQRAVIAFTDGDDNDSIATQSGVISQAQTAGIPIYAVGLGFADTTGLQTMSTQTNGQYYYAPDASQLTTIYEQIANIFTNTLIISWPSFTATSGDEVVIMITYKTAQGSYSTAVSITIP